MYWQSGVTAFCLKGKGIGFGKPGMFLARAQKVLGVGRGEGRSGSI